MADNPAYVKLRQMIFDGIWARFVDVGFLDDGSEPSDEEITRDMAERDTQAAIDAIWPEIERGLGPEQRADLEERLKGAVVSLEGLAAQWLKDGSTTEYLRLKSKAQGVQLALSYLMDYGR